MGFTSGFLLTCGLFLGLYSVSVPTYPIRGGGGCSVYPSCFPVLKSPQTSPTLNPRTPLCLLVFSSSLSRGGSPKDWHIYLCYPWIVKPSPVQNQRNQTETDAAGEIHKSVIRYLGNPKPHPESISQGGTSTNRSTTAPNAAASSHHQINSFFFS